MSRANTVRRFAAAATPQHTGSFPLTNEEPLKDEDRITPPVIEVRENEGWYAITTAPRGEKRLLKHFISERLAAYAPMETVWVDEIRLKVKLKRETQKPMLPGYVFLCVPDDSRVWYDLRQRHRDGASLFGVSGVVMNEGKPCRIPTPILRQLAEEERDGWFDARRRSKLMIAQNPDLGGPSVRAKERLRIIGGPFATYEGVAEDDSAQGHVRALISIFGRETMTVVPVAQVENLDRETMADLDRVAAPMARKQPMSGLAQAQGTGPLDWRTLEERRIRRVDRNTLRIQQEAQDARRR